MIKAKNILFDLGGVILNIDLQLTINAFDKIGAPNFKEAITSNPIFKKFEAGALSKEAFLNELQNTYAPRIATSTIIKAWNAMLLDVPIRRLQILQQLQLHYNTALLSNTNPIHEEAFNKILKQQCGFNTFNVFFDKVFYSHQIKCRKPTPTPFHHVLEYTAWKAAETVFIDDTLENIITAQEIGFQTVHVTKGMSMEKDIFKNLPTS